MKAPMLDIWVYLAASPLLGLTITLLAYLLATLTPGPNVLLVVKNGLQLGWRPALLTIGANLFCQGILIFLVAMGVGALLQTLPAQQRDAIVHTKLDGRSVRDTAGAMNISEASVKVAVHRGLKALAAHFRTGNEGIAS